MARRWRLQTKSMEKMNEVASVPFVTPRDLPGRKTFELLAQNANHLPIVMANNSNFLEAGWLLSYMYR